MGKSKTAMRHTTKPTQDITEEEITERLAGFLGEGDYLTYTQRWVRQMEADFGFTSNPLYFFYFSHFLADESKIMALAGQSAEETLTIIDVEDGSATKIDNEIDFSTVYAQTQAWSMYFKYYASVTAAWNEIVVYKDGVKIFTFTVTAPDWFVGVAVSPTGRFIVTVEEDEDAVPDRHYVRLYEGS